jgi:hypothetical protein
MMANEHITVGSNSYENVKILEYLGSLLTNQKTQDGFTRSWRHVKWSASRH